jgi:hypothetical protein
MTLRESKYLVYIGNHTYLLRIEELVSGPALWGGKFRLQLCADRERQPKTIYGSSELEVAERGAEYLVRQNQVGRSIREIAGPQQRVPLTRWWS